MRPDSRQQGRFGKRHREDADYAPFLTAIQTAKARPTVAAWSEMDDELNAAVTAVMNGDKTAQAAMDELAVAWDALLAE